MMIPLLPPTWFPFVIPWDDAVKGTATDVSFLNAAPAGAGGRIVVRNGHFVEARTGKRVRFMGTNLTVRAAFPSHADADRVAGRLAKAGFNIVRFHHMQNGWDLDGGSIWKKDRSMVAIDPKQLDRLDYFVAALKRRGIYTNLNLQTTRDYVPELGFPEEVRQLKDFAKKIDKVDRRMIALQKAYAKDLLDRKNPYTGLRYRDEPALAVVEINNENSLVGWPGETPGQGLAEMPPHFRGEVVAAWNGWLKRTYRDDASLQKAWAAGITTDGPSLIQASNRWSEENQSGGDVRPIPVDEHQNSEHATPIARDVRSNAGPDWHVQLHQTGLDLKEGATYTARFTASCTQASDVTVSASLDQADWHNVGLSRKIRLTPAPQTFRLTFVAHDVRAGHNRIAFAIGAARGVVRISGLELRPGLGGPVIPEGTSLAKGTVPIPDGGTPTQMRDWKRFLVETETAYADEMRGYLRKDLGIRANLIDTQIQWGGLTALTREAGSDFADGHFYWEHPDFPRGAWDPKDWTVRNTSMVAAMARGEGGITGLALNRVAGKSYTISEYNHPAPNEYRVEMLPVLASFAAAQDWDGFYVFEYGTTGTGQPNDGFRSFFDTAQDPVKAAFFPAAALIFRGGEVPVSPSTATLSVPASRPWETAVDAGAAWRGANVDPWSYRTALSLSSGATVPKANVKRAITAPPVLSLLKREGSQAGGLAVPGIASARGAKGPVTALEIVGLAEGVVGTVGGADFGGSRAGSARFGFANGGNRFAAATLTPLDRKPLMTSSRILLTIANRAENEGMGWNAARTTVGDRWSKGPVHAEGVECVVSIPGNPKRVVWALDPSGRRKVKVPSSLVHRELTFKTHPRYRTLWYEIAVR